MFGVAVAFVTLGEVPTALAWAGIALITAGAYAVGVARVEGKRTIGWRDAAFGLGCACAWAISPVLIRKGLDGFDRPLLGLTLGLAVSVLAYAAALAARGTRAVVQADALTFKLAAGVFVALSTWGRWAALDGAAVAVVLALSLLSVPVVLVLSPVVMGRHVERVTGWVWGGSTLIVAGSLLLVARTL